MRNARLLFIVFLPLVASRSSPTHALEGPCETWTGRLRGNGDLALRLDFCGTATVTGTMSMSSPESGYSVRHFAGTRAASGMIARETSILRSRYRAGWWHCPVDRYDLHLRAPDLMRGTFVSRACADRGTLTLRRVR